ncbi:heparinase II/III family protein [Vagococcus sp. CY52-2]|uniref:heparinase II/III family protein n=1 Tax=Vagococcus sp. CY52-2 TaxID=2925838 RepID=UPI001F573904|nr:heparinase II/III family protein [Vagococcus sp. CY52-2]UNM89423.1 heparinase II/III family protein [Vagococcus sp. CY52-2]
MKRTFFDKQEANIMLMHTNSQLLLENKFQFIHPYDMEPCRDIIAFVDGIDWTHVPFEDEEWNYMLNRQEYLLDLCLSFDITRDSIYLQKGKNLLLDWITQNQTSENWRTIDTGIRLMYWEMTIHYLEERSMLSNSESEKIAHSIEQQTSYLDDHYIDKYDLSNWGILIVTGFFITSKRIGIRQESGIYQRMLNRLTNQLRLQIQPSGNHWEQSPLYFMEVLRSIVCIHQSQVLRDEPVQKLLEEKILSMYHFMPHFVTPEGTTILQGDTDEMRVEDVIQTLSLLYQQDLPELFTRQVSVDYLLLYFSRYKTEYLAWQENLSKKVATNYPKTMTDDFTGNYYYHNDWDSMSSYAHLYNGPLGSGHGHLSLCHIDVTLGGDNILVDSGRLTYVESPLRYLLKEAPQHNTVVINSHPFGEVLDSWRFETVPTSLSNRVYEDDRFWAVRSAYVDTQVNGDFKVVRTVLYIKELDSFIILDQVVDIGDNAFSNMTRYFNLNPKIKARQEQDHVSLDIKNKRYYAYFSEESIHVEESFFAPTYNDLVVNEKIMATSSQPTQYTVLTKYSNVVVKETTVQKTDNKLCSEEKCYGMAITIDGQEWLIYSMIEDTYSGHKLYKIDGHPVYGQFGVVKIDRNNEENYMRLF